MLLKRLAALAEILLVLVLGNLVGEALFGALAPAAVLAGNASDVSQAIAEGVLIFMRLGLAGALGYLLLYWRRGLRPGQAGLTRNGQPLGLLVRQGALMGVVSGFAVAAVFAINAVLPLGAGLPAWETYSDRPINLAFWVYVLGTSVLIPPLTEEIMTRGYMRVRLVEDYGVMAGVLLTSLAFGLFHTRYLAPDGMLLMFMAVLLLNSLTWTYLAQRSGSVIPSMVAHSIGNGIGTAVLFDIWIPFVVAGLIMLYWWRPIRDTLAEFFDQWRRDERRGSLWQGLGIILVILVTALIGVEALGRTNTLIALGLFCLLVILANLLRREAAPQ